MAEKKLMTGDSEAAAEVCRLLGLPSNRVTSIELRLEARKAAIVRVEFVPTEDQVLGITEAIVKDYVLAERGNSN